jgi:UPF0755 protein
MGRGLRWLGWLLAAAGALALVAGWWIDRWAGQPRAGSGETVLVDLHGIADLDAAAERLAAAGVIDDAARFAWWARHLGPGGLGLRPVELALADDLSPAAVLAALQRAPAARHPLRIAPGARLDEVAARFEAAGLAEAEALLARARDAALLQRLGIAADSLEGYLPAGEHRFARRTPLDAMLARLVAAGRAARPADWRRRARRWRMSEHELVTLASLIEAESRAPAQLRPIAGVLRNRLRFDWKLASDASARHAAWLATGAAPAQLGPAELAREHPYNTHIHKGLPPGPIGAPSPAALAAALRPERHQAMFHGFDADGRLWLCADWVCARRMRSGQRGAAADGP